MRKFLSIFFLLIFLLLFPLSLLSLNLKTSVLNPAFLRESFRQINFYSRIVKVDPRKVANYIASKGGGNEKVPPEQISKVLSYISPEDLQYTVEKNIDQYLASVKRGESNFPVDLIAIKRSVLTKQTDPQTKELFSQIPDIYTPPQTNQTAKGYSSFLSIGKFLSYASYIFVALCLILSFVLWPTWRGRLRLIGVVLLIYGILILVLELIAQRVPIPRNIIADFLDDILRDLLQTAKAKFLLLYLKESIVMISIGFALFLVSFFLKISPASPAPAQPTKTATT